MKRAGVRRLRRNLAVAIGNSGDPRGRRGARERSAEEPTCRDPLVAEHVAWAVEKLAERARMRHDGRADSDARRS